MLGPHPNYLLFYNLLIFLSLSSLCIYLDVVYFVAVVVVVFSYFCLLLPIQHPSLNLDRIAAVAELYI